ncbi:MAG: DUF3574 domain-containing protein, partial [Chitinophagaceae bacterium]|nr:DUF3574 domain-containing protein [Rubrivivax sp.]
GAATLAAPAQPAASVERASTLWAFQRCDPGIQAQAFARIELFFGLSRPGGVITETEFQQFVDQQVTLRFPDGLTVLSGSGQFRDASGTVIVEPAKLLVLLVPRADREVSAKVEKLRSLYKDQFAQQSVLRTDETSCVSF